MLKLKTSDAFDKIQGDIVSCGFKVIRGSSDVFTEPV